MFTHEIPIALVLAVVLTWQVLPVFEPGLSLMTRMLDVAMVAVVSCGAAAALKVAAEKHGARR